MSGRGNIHDKKAYQVVGDGHLHGLVRKTENCDDFSNSVGSVVEGEQGVAAFRHSSARDPRYSQSHDALLIRLSSLPQMIGFKNSSVTSLA